MKNLKLHSSSLICSPPLFHHPQIIGSISEESGNQHLRLHAAKSGGGFSLGSVTSRCKTCKGQGPIECPGCKGTGKNKKNGNIFERWKCFECQGFGLKSCPVCSKGGLQNNVEKDDASFQRFQDLPPSLDSKPTSISVFCL